MGRELRRVPENWEHPKNEHGNFQPMYDEYYLDAFNEWLDDHKNWLDGTHEDLKEDPKRKALNPFWANWNGDAPDVSYYQQKKYSEEDLTHIQLYESTSEGTPISPVFKSSELKKLCEWAEKNATTFGSFTATKEEWFNMLSNGLVYHEEGNITFM